MTRSMTTTKPVTIRMLPPLTQAQAARLRANRRKALVNTILEALTTIGLGTCFVLCAVMIIALV